MYRFVNFKKFCISHAHLSSAPVEMQYARTCTLCNRISVHHAFTGRPGMLRMHYTGLNLERSVFVRKNKKYKVRGVPSSITKSPHRIKYEKKTRITILDSISATKQDTIFDKPVFSSALSSSVFNCARLSNIGVTLMLPPSLSKTPNGASSSISSLKPLSPLTFQEQPPIHQPAGLSYAATNLKPNRSTVNKPAAQNTSQKFENKNDFDVHDEICSVAVQPGEEIAANERLSDVARDTVLPQTGRKKADEQEMSEITEKKKVPKKTHRRSKNSVVRKDVVVMPKTANKDSLNEYLVAHRVKASKLKRITHRTAYVDVCANSGRLKHAFLHAANGLKFFSDSYEKNQCLEPLFCHASLEKEPSVIRQALSLAEAHHVKLSILSYVVCFELMGRIPQSAENTELIQDLFRKMKGDGVSVEDLVDFCGGRFVLINKIMKAIHMVNPDFVPPSQPSQLYHTDVLSSLNDTAKAKASMYSSPATGLLPADSIPKLVDEQIDMHYSTVVKIKNISCELSEPEMKKFEEMQEEVERAWRESIAAGFLSDMNTVNDKKGNFRLATYLRCLPVEKFVEVIIQEVYSRFNDSDKQSVGLVHAERHLGKRVKDLYDHSILKKYGLEDQARDAHIAYSQWYADPESHPHGPSHPREIWDNLVHTLDYNDSFSSHFLREWSSLTLEAIGKFLYNILLKDVKVDENFGSKDKPPHMVPALYIVFRKTTKGYQKQIKMHPAIHKVFLTKQQPFLSMNAFELPMVCPPRPWVSIKSGIYPLLSPPFQRAPESEFGAVAMSENLEKTSNQDLYPCFDSLNQLSSIPWRVNIPVLDVVTEVFQSGGSDILTIPKPPSAAIQEPIIPENASLHERLQIGKERVRIKQENAATYSLWCDTLYKLCIAHEFRDRIFWLPHNMDFRGRVYPVCPHLQHMSNDMARSLLCFAKGEKLGPDGLNWLKLHLVNLVGHMSKESLAMRLAHANEILPKIIDSAEKPLAGDKWWMESEEPWQTLAACKEIAAAIKSGDPENFISYFPVHQDGSCNGLQHYAALGRDTLGAKSVNLVDSEKPSDVYSCVSDLVEQQRAKDAAGGNALAQSLEGYICRKVVKQTVMTTVYGVTLFGAVQQIRGRLKDMDYPIEKISPAAKYISRLVFQSLGEMFTSSRNIQDWLTKCATGIVKTKVATVQWVTPLGLPVIQPYLRGLTEKSASVIIPKHQWDSFTFKSLPIGQKNRNAFSPNFIHSLDSCHMMMTGLHCEQSKIPFVSVHDCYWVHAKNVTEMSKICREQFVALHSEPILEDLSKYLVATYCPKDHTEYCPVKGVDDRRLTRIFTSVPPKGDFDLREVLRSRYFFS